MADQLDPQTLLDNIRGQNQQQPSTQPAQQTPTPSGIDPASMLANIRASAPAAPVQQQSPSSKSGWLSGLWDSTFGALTHAPEILGSVVSPIGIMGVNTPGTPSPVIAKAVTNAPASADLIKKEGALGVAKQLPFVSQAIQNYNDLEDPNSRSYGVGEAIGNAGMLLAPFAGKIPIVRDVVIPAAYMGGDAVLGGLKSSPLYAGKLLDGLKLASSSALDSITGLSKDPAELTIQALRGSVPKNRTNFKFNLQQSIPDIKAAESSYGKPIEGIDDLIGTPATPTDLAKPGVIQLAKEANRNLYNQYMGPHSAAGSMIDTTPVADAIEASIPAKFRQLPAYKPVVDQIIAKADGYRGKQFSIDDVDSFRGTTNDELSSYYDENPAAKRAAVGSNPKTAALDAEANALRKVQYDKLEDPNQPYVVKDIQKRYGYLSELQKSLEARRNVALRQAPQNLSEQLSKWSSIGDALRGGARFIGGLGTGQLGVAASGLGDIAGGIGKMAAAKWMKGQIQTDSLLTRAFKNATPSAPEPGPSAAFLNSVTPAATPVSPGLNPLSKQLPGTTPQTPTPLQNQMGITTGGNKAPGVGKASPTTPTVPAGISPFPAKPIPAPVAAPKPSFNPVGGQIPSASPHVAPTPLESIMGASPKGVPTSPRGNPVNPGLIPSGIDPAANLPKAINPSEAINKNLLKFVENQKSVKTPANGIMADISTGWPKEEAIEAAQEKLNQLSKKATPEQLSGLRSAINEAIAKHGSGDPKFIGAGGENPVYDIGNGKVLKIRPEDPDNTTVDRDLAEKQFQSYANPTIYRNTVQVGDTPVHIEISNKLRVNKTANANELAKHVFDRTGKFPDPATENFGYDKDGNLKVLDPGGATDRYIPNQYILRHGR